MTDTGERQARVALITGGASGIGLATAEELHAAGWKVVIADIGEEALDEVRQGLGSRPGVRVTRLDVTDEPAVEREVAAVEEELGPIAGVVNSAGIAADKHVFDTPVDLFRRILDINVVGTFIVARAAARQMQKRQRGAIVNLASIAGVRGSKGRSAYGSSKGAVIVLTQVMANDLARHGIRVNAVAPGPVETPMIKALHTAEDRRTWMRFTPMRRYGLPEEIARTICFLLDDTQSSYITGEVIAVDGGFRGAGTMVE
ncbi:MAG: SDR family oxidoreductase [Hyphomicrobiaceae bacterium]|nr:SDR family oxidoreductase [Hyphomicrobiaceae bacterium]